MLGASISAHGSIRGSPSKIPGASGSRLPMGVLPNGNNSPERRERGKMASSQDSELNRTLRGNMGPPRVPPPKMKDLFVPPTPTPMGSNKENGLDLERPGSVLRHIEADDPYDDRRYENNHYSSMHSSSSHGSRGHMLSRSVGSFASTASRPMSRQEYPVAPPISRQTSNTSSVMSGSQVSGSENWETYDSNSDNEEADATEAYYAKMKHQQSQLRQTVKRPGTASGQLGGIKRIREQPIVEEGREGSEAGWTDDGSVGETY